MLKNLICSLLALVIHGNLIAQNGKLHVGIQYGIAVPTGQFASGYGSLLDNGY